MQCGLKSDSGTDLEWVFYAVGALADIAGNCLAFADEGDEEAKKMTVTIQPPAA